MTDTPAREITMRDLKPYWNRCTVIESTVDEAQRDSGLIVPLGAGEAEIHRGIVLDVVPEGWTRSADDDPIQQGTVVYYREGITIGDVTVVDLDAIIAYIAE